MTKHLRAIALLLVLIGVCVPVAALAQPFTPVLQIHVLDVGQGDSTLIIGPGPEKRTLLVDAGEELKGGSRSHYKEIAQKIRTLTGKSSIDYVVISHYHFDHMGTQTGQRGDGLWGLIEDEKIHISTIIDRGDNVQFGDPTGPHKKYSNSIQTWLQQKRVDRRETAVLGRNQINLGGAIVVEVVAVNGEGVLQRVNAARPGFYDRCPPSENDYSIALKVSVGIFEYFTGGDLAGFDDVRHFGSTCVSYNDVETTIASRVGNVEVMKINHHGSFESSNTVFMQTLAPEFIIVTSGSGNDYNHPSHQAMARATTFGEVLITGGVSPAEWPHEMLLPGMTLIGSDVNIQVDAGGKQYELQGKLFRSFSDAEEARGDDRRYFEQNIRNKSLIPSPSVRDRH